MIDRQAKLKRNDRQEKRNNRQMIDRRTKLPQNKKHTDDTADK